MYKRKGRKKGLLGPLAPLPNDGVQMGEVHNRLVTFWSSPCCSLKLGSGSMSGLVRCIFIFVNGNHHLILYFHFIFNKYCKV